MSLWAVNSELGRINHQNKGLGGLLITFDHLDSVKIVLEKKKEKTLALTSDAHFIHLPVLLIHRLSGDVIAQADRAERNEAEVEGIQEVPVVLQRREDGSWDEKEEADGQKAEHHGVDDAHQCLRQAPVSVDVGDRPPRAEHHYPLHRGGEEEEGEGDANRRVDDAEGLPAIGQGNRVTVSCRVDEKTKTMIPYAKKLL